MGAASDNIIVTGRVPDIRPYIRRAAVVVCPILFAVGTQNKILEPMAMGVPVVATTEAIEGMAAKPERDILIGDDPETFARRVVQLLSDEGLRRLISDRALAYVRKHHDWRTITDELADFYGEQLEKRIRRPR